MGAKTCYMEKRGHCLSSNFRGGLLLSTMMKLVLEVPPPISYLGRHRHNSTEIDMVNRQKSTEIDKNRRKSTRIAQESTFFDICRRMSTKIDSCRALFTEIDVFRQKSTDVGKSRHISTKYRHVSTKVDCRFHPKNVEVADGGGTLGVKLNMI